MNRLHSIIFLIRKLFAYESFNGEERLKGDVMLLFQSNNIFLYQRDQKKIAKCL